MSRKDIGKRMAIETAQIRSILSDYRKTKEKCITICDDLHEDLPKKVHFESVEKQTTLKMNILDLNGLVELKNILVRTLTELFDVENDLLTKKQKYNARKEIGNVIGTQNLVKRGIEKQYHKNVSFPEQNLRNSPTKGPEPILPSENQPPRKLTNLEESRYSIPIYHAHNDSNENKVDRVSKYVASLKRNMKHHSKAEGDAKSETRAILLHQPMYTKMKEELERFKMREEELQLYINRRIQEGVNRYISNLEVVHENKNYKTVKIYKQCESFLKETPNNISYSTQKTMQPPSLINQPFSQPIPNIQPMCSVSIEQGESHEDLSGLTSFQLGLNKNQYNVEEVVSRISQTLENSEIKLRELRNQRKKMFLDDDVWAQFEQI